ncbi:MAG TPA: hypothetical protein PK858_10115, partial [Saprospiraceae bacterium]|nr:hypothetical protein [Saprospiraceae bacterium]
MISNPEGQLQFSTNGCHILNRNHQIMENGSPLNEGPVFDGFCGTEGYPAAQPIICLPYPGHPEQYMVLHIRIQLGGANVWYKDVLRTVVDMSKNGGLGAVLERNIQLAQGDVGQNNFTHHITATRHGNGRDWWIAMPTFYGKKTYLFLLTPKGVQGPYVRQNAQGLESWAAGQIGFSPDGSWFCEGLGKGIFRLSRFDRCSGVFYDQRLFDFQGETPSFVGVAFSPNSRFLYISRTLKIEQYDLLASDIQASRQTVAEHDGMGASFYQAMLAPNNKIYLTAGGLTKFLHVIHAPDSLGVACRVMQHELEIMGKHSYSAPNFPYFRLYDLAGSACDTLGINGPVSAAGEPGGQGPLDLRLSPVPASEVLSVEFGAGAAEGSWQVVDMSGRLLRSGQKAALDAALVLPVGDLPGGMYAF